MEEFAELLDRLVYTGSRNAKLTLLAGYFRATADPDRGWALSALTDGLPLRLPMLRCEAKRKSNRSGCLAISFFQVKLAPDHEVPLCRLQRAVREGCRPHTGGAARRRRLRQAAAVAPSGGEVPA